MCSLPVGSLTMSEIGQFFSPLCKNVLMPILTTLIGAFAGAYITQRITERGKESELQINQINNLNTTIAILSNTLNTFINLKTQTIKPIKDTFEQQEAAYENQPSLTGDLRTITPLKLPLEILTSQLFEKISIDAPSVFLGASLIHEFHSLSELINNRNQWINEFKSSKKELTPAQYFGLRDDQGITDKTISSNIQDLFTCTDNCLFYSDLLLKRLKIIGDDLCKQHNKKYKASYKTPKMTFRNAPNIMPDPTNYHDWTSLPKPEFNF